MGRHVSGKEFALHVQPRLPDAIDRLAELASNFWFGWHRPTRLLFASLNQDLWRHLGRSPKLFLRSVDQTILDAAATDDTFLAAYHQVLAEYDAYHTEQLDGYPPAGLEQDDVIAYFCAEYGLHESFPNYSGGLGILAGDHCKTASDLGLPFVGVGLLYRRGYFRQTIDHLGEQIAHYHDNRVADLPVTPAVDSEEKEMEFECPLPGRHVVVKVWHARVGRIAVFFLDTNLPENTPEDREITHTLYGGDSELRIQQEIVLGVGGVRALRALGYEPHVWHINEGHAAFLVLERIRELVAGGLGFTQAVEATAANTVFTTHTPVAAGHDVFSRERVEPYLQALCSPESVTAEAFFELGQTEEDPESFDMTRLALSGARFVNGVSRMHGGVSKKLCATAWPEVPPRENPVGYVTNGVHMPTFLADGWRELFDGELGPQWRQQVTNAALFERIEDIPDERFWSISQSIKREMLEVVRDRLTRQHLRNHMSEVHLDRVLKFIDPNNPEILTIGFARRFATYKRANLLFQDMDWLGRILGDETRPLVFIFAGKAHPADEPGQKLLKEIHRISNLPNYIGRIVLVEDYDMSLARPLTAGVDVWLNTPIYPLEASGTSGMKAAMNGTVNLSVLDGWWAEAYNGRNGWAIPPFRGSDDEQSRDAQDARTLCELLQDQVIPLYYDKDPNCGYSPHWIEKCKRSMSSVIPDFNMQRVLHQYACQLYAPAARHGGSLSENSFDGAARLAQWKQHVRDTWPGLTLRVHSEGTHQLSFGEACVIEADVELNGLAPADVRVECVLLKDDRSLNGAGSFGRGADTAQQQVEHFEPIGAVDATGEYRYRLELQPPWCGPLRYRIRAVPHHRLLAHPYEMGLMRWLT